MILQLRAKLINKDGEKRLEFLRPDYYKEVIRRLNENWPIWITIRNAIPRRTNQQNKFLHGVVFPIIGELTGYTAEEAKEVCKKLFILPKIVIIKDIEIEIPRGTSELDKKEMIDFIDKVKVLANDLGGNIPNPCDVGFFCGKPECPICGRN